MGSHPNHLLIGMILQVLPQAKKNKQFFCSIAMVVIQCPLASPWFFPFGPFIFVGENNLFSSNFAGVPRVHDAVYQLLILGWKNAWMFFVWCCPFWTHPSTNPPVEQQKTSTKKKTENPHIFYQLGHQIHRATLTNRFGRLLCHVGLSSCRWPLSSGCWGFPGEVP